MLGSAAALNIPAGIFPCHVAWEIRLITFAVCVCVLQGSGFGVPSSSSEVIPPLLHSAVGRKAGEKGKGVGRGVGREVGREAGKRTGREADREVGRGAAWHCGIGDPKNSNQTVICFNSAF